MITLEKEKSGIVWTASDEETAQVLDHISRLMLPLASHVIEDVPNVVVALREPIDLKDLHRKRLSGRNAFVARLSDVDTARGFFLRVREPDDLAETLETRGLLGWLSDQHSELIEPGPEDIKRLRRGRLGQIVGSALLVIWLASNAWNVLEALSG